MTRVLVAPEGAGYAIVRVLQVAALTGGMLGVLSAGVSCQRTSGSSASAAGEAAPPSAAQIAPVLRVRVIRPHEQGMERRTSRPGSVHAFAYANLFANVPGYVEKQQVDIGSRVKKGDLLAVLFAPELWADLDRTKATVNKNEADIEVKEAAVTTAQANLEQALAQVDQARADLDRAGADLELRREEYGRYDKLVKAKAIEAELLDEKRAARRSAEASELSARKEILTAKARVAATRAAIIQAQAGLKDARASLAVAVASRARAQALVDYTQIKSPYTGVVTARNFHEGDFVRDASASTGIDPLFRVARIDLMRVIVYVPDKDAPFVKVDDPAELRVDALPDDVFQGKVARVAFAEDYSTRTMRTEIDLPNKDERLRDGMFGTVTIHLGRYKGVTVPSKCVTTAGTKDERSVFVVRDQKARRLKIRLLANDGINATIVAPDLRPDDWIIAERNPGLEDGMPVEPITDKNG